MKQNFVLFLLAGYLEAKTTILNPPYTATGQEIAVVWIGGAHYEAGDYLKIAMAF
jgi:hypothetical protein